VLVNSDVCARVQALLKIKVKQALSASELHLFNIYICSFVKKRITIFTMHPTLRGLQHSVDPVHHAQQLFVLLAVLGADYDTQ
jgi:hypothetical protein